ncbi:DUF2975 domain-containing protein [Microbacterium sp. NPDC077184]|uniref:DUF2975 domain-containing protein n=1 Tax=Microbacterium sp. NPDC077184 TaxID=3154764 RepID=UPI0034191E63
MTKVLIVVLFAAVAACQLWVVPQIAAAVAQAVPEYAALEMPGVLMVGALLLCVQVVLVCVWRLLTLAARETIFDEAAFRWVDAIIVTVVIAGLLIAAGMVVIDRAQAGSPFVALTGLIALIAVAGLALVVVVMRGLLRQATALRQEMAEVV